MIIDALIWSFLFISSVLIYRILYHPIGTPWMDSDFQHFETNLYLWPLLFFLLFIIYYILLDSILGGTIGKKLLRITVVNNKFKKMSIMISLSRTLIFFVLAIFWLDFLPLLFDKTRGRCLHDILTRTYVISAAVSKF